jgi:hypothetical protein
VSSAVPISLCRVNERRDCGSKRLRIDLVTVITALSSNLGHFGNMHPEVMIERRKYLMPKLGDLMESDVGDAAAASTGRHQKSHTARSCDCASNLQSTSQLLSPRQIVLIHFPHYHQWVR